ncbi:MAG: NAD(P)H-dependent oxidoreductase subunit E [Bacteroidales bacterium]|nr:NAD(P)H-dependent oxidoreductase subunit E [Bacteroidales bacterium]MDD3989263.1 NAD(P)H-dependent oxidoreductase subunit E [Bacteroidales bacterium]MDD4639077.1 NAD(P)H-dependent oxidoreductase subunit E [Bacteroidales bacterium]
MNTTHEIFVDKKIIDGIIAKNVGKPGDLLTVMEEVQEVNEFKFLDPASMEYISTRLKVPLSQIYSVATFYSFFNLKPQGKNTIIVCRGTACHTKGSKVLLDDLTVLPGCKEALDSGESSFTTDDKQITVKTVACFGQCALAPVVAVNSIIYSNVTSEQILQILQNLQEGKKDENLRLR